jgi:hypothetical protein
MRWSHTTLLLVALATGGLLGFLAADLNTEPAPELPLTAEALGPDSKPETVAQLETEPSTSAVSDDRGVISATQLLQRTAADLENARVYEQDDRTLEQKYAGASNAELLAAWVLLKDRRQRECERIGQLLIKADRLTVSIPGQTPEGPTTATVGGPLSFIHTIEGSSEGAIVKGAHINGDEFPDYRALELEVFWLEQRTATIRKSL